LLAKILTRARHSTDKDKQAKHSATRAASKSHSWQQNKAQRPGQLNSCSQPSTEVPPEGQHTGTTPHTTPSAAKRNDMDSRHGEKV